MLKVLPIKYPSRFPSPAPAVLGVALLLLLVPLFFIAPAVSAAGDNIRVISNEREVRFPGDVVFNLEVEGEADIVEVRLYFRVAPSRIWTYTYPDLTPSRHVETSFNLDVSGVSYVPPGTELEYYYSVLDTQGNILKTRPETFVYVDARFQWQTVEAGPLTIFWHDLSEKRVREVAQKVEESLIEVGELLRVNLDVPLRGVIYNSRKDAREAFPNQSSTITQVQVFQGFAFPERGVFVGVGFRPGLIVHESTHLLLEQATSSPRARVPAWVNEGLASYMEPGAHARSRGFPGAVNPDRMPLRHMYSVPGRPEAIRYFYQKAESVVGYLLENYGAAKFRTFIGQLDEGRRSDKALMATYGFGLDGLDQGWYSSMGEVGHEEDTGGDGFGFPLSSLSTLLIAILVLVVMGLMVANFVARRLSKGAEEVEEWDGLTEEEWDGRP